MGLNLTSPHVCKTEVPSGKSYTYGQLKEKVEQVASGMHQAGFTKDDVVMVFSGNQLDFTVLFLACSCLGVWLSPANPQFTAGESNIRLFTLTLLLPLLLLTLPFLSLLLLTLLRSRLLNN